MSDQAKSHTWTIKGELFKKVLSAKNKEVFKSDIFTIEDLKWQIELCPNGYKPSQLGSFQIYVKLVALPKQWKRIIVSRSIKCPQTQSGITVLASYDRSGHSRGWATNTLKLSEIKALKSSKLVINVRTQILQFILRKNNKIFFNKSQTLKIRNQTLLKWKLSRTQLKIAQRAYNGKCIVSEVFKNGIWCLKLLPNGSTKEEKGQSMIGLQLCSNMIDAYAIDIEVSVAIKAMDFKKSQRKKYIFLKGAQWIKIGSFKQFQKCKSFTVIFTLKIVKKYKRKSLESQTKKVTQMALKPKKKFGTSDIQSLNAEMSRYQQEMSEKFGFYESIMKSMSSNINHIQTNMSDRKMVGGFESEMTFATKMSQNSVKNTDEMQQTLRIMQTIQKQINYQMSLYDSKYLTFSSKINHQITQMQQSIQNESELNQIKFAEMNEKLQSILSGNESGKELSDLKPEFNVQKSDGQMSDLDRLAIFVQFVLQMPQYLDVIIESGFNNIESLYEISNQDLEEMSIRIADRKKILKVIKQEASKIYWE